MRRPGAYPVWLALNGAGSFFSSLIFTVTAVYYVTEVGMNPLQLVLLGTVMELSIFVFEVPTGVLADTYSRRVSVIVAMFVQGAALVLVGLVPQFETILLAWIIWGLGWTFESGALDAWVADELPDRDLERVYMRGSQVSMLAAFPGIGASVLLASVDLQLPIVLGGALIASLGFFLIAFMPERGFAPAPRHGRSSFGSMGATVAGAARVVRSRPRLLLIMAIAALFGMYTEGFDRLWEAHFLRSIGLPDFGGWDPVLWFGIINAGGMLLTIAAQQLWLRRREPAGPFSSVRALFVLDWVILASVLVFALAGSFYLALAACWIAGVARRLDRPIFTAWINQNIDSPQRATVLSIVNQSDAIGQVGGGPVLGGIGTVWGLRAALVSAAAVLLPALGLYAHALRRGGRERVLEEAAEVAEATEAVPAEA
jgi:DHA3 family tetracycline resistance protein-like MFS transporter